MKKLIPLILFLLGSVMVKAQSVTVAVTTPACNNDGVLTATITGVAGAYDVNWSIGSDPMVTHTGITGSTDTYTGYSGAAGYVIISVGSATLAYTYVTAAPPFDITATTVPAACPALGSATATVTGGASPYSYEWYDMDDILVSTSNPASLPGGAYHVTVTDVAGCSFTIGNDSFGTSGIYVEDIPAFSFSVGSTVASCTNGTATVGAITGGTAPFGYLWSTGATTSSLSGLMMGSYAVTVTDADGCEVISSTYVSQTPYITVNTTNTPATCIESDGASIAFGSGGMSPYTYLWNTGATTASVSGLPSGYYFVTATDANGCIGNGYANIGATTPITVTYSTTASSCTSATGSASLTIAGGLAPYNVTWYTYPSMTTGSTISGVMAGNYSFNIVDANGCVRSGMVNIPPEHIISLSLSTSPATCTASDGSVSSSMSGATLPVTYLWSTTATTSSITGVPMGGYSLTVTDADGCSNTKYASVTSSSPITLSVSSTSTSCIFSSDGSIDIDATGGTAPYSYTWYGGGVSGTGSSLTGLATGGYWVYVSDAAGCTASTYVYVNYGSSDACYCTISGTVYHDANSNCIQDAGEEGIHNILVHCSGGYGSTWTNSDGEYSFIVPTGTYTVHQDIESYYPLNACASNDVSVSTVAASGCVQTVNFADSLVPIHDMHITTTSINLPVPGNSYHQKVIFSNQGTVTEGNIEASYNPDGQLAVPSFVSSGVFTGSPYWYTFGGGALSLNPGESQVFNVYYDVPTSIPLSTNVVFKDTTAYSGPISNWLNDYSPWNNVNYYETYTVGSYDPNFKEVSPRGTGPEGFILATDSVLEYTVHFQNTGTWFAENIVVIDTLDADLDWATLTPVYSSHNAVVTLSDNGVLKYTFNHIMLPTMTSNEPGSSGFFTYSIKPKGGLAIGTQLTNDASIYFDYNAPIVTNSVLNTLQEPTAVDHVHQVANGNFTVFPNPARDMVTVEINSLTKESGVIEVSDVSGKRLLVQNVTAQAGKQNITLSVAGFTPGIYFVSYKGSTQKLVIMK